MKWLAMKLATAKLLPDCWQDTSANKAFKQDEASKTASSCFFVESFSVPDFSFIDWL